MPQRTRIDTGDDEFLIVEDPSDPQFPQLRILARPAASTLAVGAGCQRFATEEGTWALVARWDGSHLELHECVDCVEPRHEQLMQRLVTTYLERREKAQQNAASSCYYAVVNGRPAGELVPAQPRGFVLALHREREGAEEALRRLQIPGSVERTGPLREFLALRAEQGYAGAILDDQDPVFWCVDGDSRLQFLRLVHDRERDELRESLLDARSVWQEYEGDEKLELFEDQESWDQSMVEILGPVPYLGYEKDQALFTCVENGEAVYFEDDLEGEESCRMLAVFHTRESAQEFLAEHELEHVDLEEIEDLHALVAAAAEHGAVARLQPGDHRARGGSLWRDGDAVVLDSFSGFWRSRQGLDFCRYES